VLAETKPRRGARRPRKASESAVPAPTPVENAPAPVVADAVAESAPNKGKEKKVAKEKRPARTPRARKPKAKASEE